MSYPSLESLGPRICILGPSNSGKSTLAQAISTKKSDPIIHLDQLFHYPNTNWKPRPFNEFVELHDKAIQEEQWIIEGNYTKTLPQRLERATGFILLDSSTLMSLIRYFQRTWFQKEARLGALAGNQDSIKWDMIRHITIVTPNSRRRYRDLYSTLEMPKCFISSRYELKRAYKQWQLVLPK